MNSITDDSEAAGREGVGGGGITTMVDELGVPLSNDMMNEVTYGHGSTLLEAKLSG